VEKVKNWNDYKVLKVEGWKGFKIEKVLKLE
jgi:hypothetical protein